jgi:hypothetical protein
MAAPRLWAALLHGHKNLNSARVKLVLVPPLAAIDNRWAFARRCQSQYAMPGLYDDAGGHLLHTPTT